MKKRVLSLLLCLVMALSLVPVTAHAVDYYGVMVGDTPITSDNCDDVFGDGTVSYTHDADRNRGTLTLNGANITTGYKDTANNRTVGIYSSHDLTVYVGQDGAKVDLHNSKCSGSSYGIYVDGELIFYTGYTTPDPMTVISAAGSGSNFGVYATGDIVIDNNWGVVEAIAFLDVENYYRPGYGMAVGISHKISIESGHLYAMSYNGAATNVMPVLNDYFNDVIDKQYVFKGNSGSGMKDIQPTSSPGGLMELRVQRMFPDHGLWKFLMDRFDKDGSYYLDEEERNAVTEISGTTTASTRSAIRALVGLEYLPNLTTIDCHNELIESADLTKCPQLEKLNLNYNYNLTKLDVSKCPNLTELMCSYNQLTSLDVSNNTKLTNLYCYENPIKSLDVSMCPNLEKLDCASLGSSTLETLTLGQKNALKELCCASMALKSVDVTGCPNLEGLDSGYASGGVIDLSKNTQLKSAHLYGYKGNKLDLTHNTKLESLFCSQDSNLTSLDLSKCPNLKNVQIPANGLTSLDLSNNTKLERMYCQNNPLTSINVGKCSALEILNVNNCKLTTLNVNNNPNLVFLFCADNNLTTLNIGNKPDLLKIDCYGNKLSELDLSRTHIGSNTEKDVYRACVGNQQNDGMITVYTTKAFVNTLKSYFNLHSEDNNKYVLVEDAANYVPSAPAAPTVTLSNDAATGKIAVNWKAVEGAAKYEVYRSTSKTGTYSKILTTTELTCLNKLNATPGTVYYYKVRALDANGKAGEYSAPQYRCVDCAQPVITVTPNNTAKTITIKWAAVEGATKYEVYRATSKTGTYSKILTTTALTCTNKTNVVEGTTYYYKVKALGASANADSAYSAVVSGKIGQLAAPTVTLSNDAATGKIAVNWKAVEGAAKYEVYRATSKTGTYSKILTTTELTCLNKLNATPGTVYYYKVRALDANGAAGEYSEPQYRCVDCAQPVITVTPDNAAGTITIKWNAVEGATKYEVYRATSKTGTYSKILTTTALTCTNKTNVVAGTTYYYKVIAKGAATNSDSAYSAIVSGKIGQLASPTVTLSNDAATGKIVVNWKAVSGAAKYEVYRATSKTGMYSKILTTTELTCLNKLNATPGTIYYYKVRALDANGTAGEYSEPQYRCVDCPQPVATVSLNSSGKPVVKWNAVDGATKYEVYRATSADGTYSKIFSSTTALSCTNTNNVVSGTTYYYKVIARGTASNSDSAYSAVVSIQAK